MKRERVRGLRDGAGERAAASTATSNAERARRSRNDRLRARARRASAAGPSSRSISGSQPSSCARPRDVGPADLRVVDRQRLEDDLARRARSRGCTVCAELEHRQLVIGVAEVDRQVLAARREQVEAADQVVDVAERPRLRAVAEDGERLAVERLVAGTSRIARPSLRRIRGPYVLKIRAMHVSTPCWRVVGHRQRLGVPLRLVVDAARADRVDVAPVASRAAGAPAGRRRPRSSRRCRKRARFHFARPSALCVPYEPTFSDCERQPQVVDRARRAREVEDEVDGLVDRRSAR